MTRTIVNVALLLYPVLVLALSDYQQSLDSLSPARLMQREGLIVKYSTMLLIAAVLGRLGLWSLYHQGYDY